MASNGDAVAAADIDRAGARRLDDARLRPFRPALVATALLVLAAAGQTSARASPSPLAAGIALFPSALTFASQTVATTAPAQIVRVTNIGPDPLSILVQTSGDFSSVTSCGTALPTGESCAVAVSSPRRQVVLERAR